MACGPAGAGRWGRGRRGAAGGAGRSGARAGSGRAAAAGARLRGVPHRPARGRGRPAGAPAGGDAGARGGRRGAWRPGLAIWPASRPATARVPRGCARPTAPAGTACAARRTCARPRRTPAGTPTAATPNTSRSPRPTRTRCPPGYSDVELAPLLCAGIIGYRALKRADAAAGGRLGLYGFGGSAHLAAQVATRAGRRRARDDPRRAARELARSLGAAFVGGPADMPPEPLDAAILFAPVGDLVPPALAALDRGGTLAIAGIYLTDIPPLDYDNAPVPGAPAAQRHVEHPAGRPRVPRLRRRAQARGHHAPLPARRRGPRPGRPQGRPLRRRRGARPVGRVLSLSRTGSWLRHPPHPSVCRGTWPVAKIIFG